MGQRTPRFVGDVRYTRDRARGVMGRLKIKSSSYRAYGSPTGIAKAIAADSNLSHNIMRCLAQLGWGACGRVISVGRGLSGPIHELTKNFPLLKDAAPRHATGGWLNEDFYGALLLLHVASASLIAAMAVNIFEDLQKK
jgi:hypothetical protein